MKKIKSILFFCILITYTCLALYQEDSLKTYLILSIPQRSGLAFADFKHYQVSSDSLFVFYQPSLDTTGKYELLESYPIKKSEMEKLEKILEQTESLGNHTIGTLILGWPRFLIYANYKGRIMNGFVANCYREHIFIIVDWLNYNYPNGTVINYDKYELIKREEFEKNNE